MNNETIIKLPKQVEEITSQLDNIERVNNGGANGHRLAIPNPYGVDYEAVHPSILFFMPRWNGYNYWMAYTPYKGGNEGIENPCVCVSQDGTTWEVKGSPLAETDNKTNYHYSDTHLVYRQDTQTMEVWYRKRTRGALPNSEIILRRTTTDGTNWTVEEELFKNEGTYNYYLSPVVIFDEGKYKIWTCNDNTGNLDYFESTTGGNWNKIRTIEIEKRDNKGVWHFDIKRTSKGYEMYYSGGIWTRQNMYYSYSTDNITYSSPVCVMKPSGFGNFDSQSIYRPCILDSNGTRKIYYSGTDEANRWGISVATCDINNPTYLIGGGDRGGNNYEVNNNMIPHITNKYQIGNGGALFNEMWTNVIKSNSWQTPYSKMGFYVSTPNNEATFYPLDENGNPRGGRFIRMDTALDWSINGTVKANENENFNLGTTTNRWRSLYAKESRTDTVYATKGYIGTIPTPVNFQNDAHKNGFNLGIKDLGGKMRPAIYPINNLGLPQSGRYISFDEDSFEWFLSGSLKPTENQNFNLGTTTNRWGNLYLVNAPNVSSKRELKENIETFDDNIAYEKVKHIPLYTYNYKSGDGENMLGSMLDELPIECINEKADGVDLYAYTSYCLSALKKAIEKIEVLEKEIEIIKNK